VLKVQKFVVFCSRNCVLTVCSCIRARPVVKLDAAVTFRGESKQLSLDTKACKLPDGTAVVCTELNACLEYTGVGVDQRLGQYKHLDRSSAFHIL
jgi:hypothetical protein